MDADPAARRRFFAVSSPMQIQYPSVNPLQRAPAHKRLQNPLFTPKPQNIRYSVTAPKHAPENEINHCSESPDKATPDAEDQEAIVALARKNKKLTIALLERDRELASLRAQHDEMVSEKLGLTRRLESTKGAAKHLSASFGILEDSLRSLKSENDLSKKNLNEARLALLDVVEAKMSVLKAFEVIQPHLNEDGSLIKGSEWRHIMSELQNECLSAHQANDHLRVKLETLAGELSYAKERVSELEATQSKDGTTLQSITQNVAAAGEKVSEMASFIARRNKEHTDAIQEVATLKEKLRVSEAKAIKLEELIEMKDTELARMHVIIRENTHLTTLIQSTKDQAKLQCSQLQTQIGALTTQLTSVQESKSEVDAINTVLKESKEQLSSELDELGESHETLTQALQSANDALTKYQLESKHTLQLRQAHIAELKDEAAKIKAESSRKDDSFTALDKRFSILQERFEDQTILLRSEKERSGDIQEQLTAARSIHSAELEALKISHAVELSQLSEAVKTSNLSLRNKEAEFQQQNEAKKSAHLAEIDALTRIHDQQIASLETGLDSLKQSSSQQLNLYETQLSTANQLSLALRSQLEKSQQLISDQKQEYDRNCEMLKIQHGREKEELKNMSDERASLLQKLIEQHKGTSTAELTSIRAELACQVRANQDAATGAEKRIAMEMEAATAKFSSLHDHVARLEKELEMAKTESARMKIDLAQLPENGAEVIEQLKAREASLETALKNSKEKATTMKYRQEQGLLDEEEKIFVNSVIQMTQSMHEQEMVEKGNELRRRDNTIVALQTKVQSLEARLVNHLKEKDKEGGGAKSMVGTKAWVSSPGTKSTDSPPAQATTDESQQTVILRSGPPFIPAEMTIPKANQHTGASARAVHNPLMVSCHARAGGFAELEQRDSEDDASTFNDSPPGLGKRERGSSLLTEPDVDQFRSTRRKKGPVTADASKVPAARASNVKAPTISGNKKATKTTTYSKTRKR